MAGKRLIHKNEHDSMDPLMKALKAVHSLTLKDESMDPEDLQKHRSNQDLFCRLASTTKGIEIEPVQVSQIPCEWIRPDFPHNKKSIVLYCHGGGYTCGTLNYSRIIGTKLALHLGLEVFCFEYRLAPENPYPAAIEDAIAVWDYLMLQGYGARDVILAGDSAGGNLALEICHTLKIEERKLPKAMILMSPWTDMTMSGSSYKKYVEKDPMLTPSYIEAVRKAYAPDADYRMPELSPMFASLENYPPTLVQVGSNEILRSDSEMLVKKMKLKGCEATLQIYKGGWHVFQQMPGLNTTRAMEEIAHFVEKYI